MAVVRSRDEHALLERLCAPDWHMLAVSTFGQALAALRNCKVSAVIAPYCGSNELSWLNLQVEARRLAVPPSVIVYDSCPNGLMRAEVFALGGFALVAQPFDPIETPLILRLARERWESGLREPGDGAAHSTAAA